MKIEVKKKIDDTLDGRLTRGIGFRDQGIVEKLFVRDQAESEPSGTPRARHWTVILRHSECEEDSDDTIAAMFGCVYDGGASEHLQFAKRAALFESAAPFIV